MSFWLMISWWPHANDLLPDDAVTHLCAGDLPPPDSLLSSPINAPGARAGKSTLHHNCHVTNKKWFTKLTLPRQKIVKNLQSSDISNWRLIEIEFSNRSRGLIWVDITQRILVANNPPLVTAPTCLRGWSLVTGLTPRLRYRLTPASITQSPPHLPPPRISTMTRSSTRDDISICHNFDMHRNSEYYICQWNWKVHLSWT